LQPMQQGVHPQKKQSRLQNVKQNASIDRVFKKSGDHFSFKKTRK
jgi:hypothetical protein